MQARQFHQMKKEKKLAEILSKGAYFVEVTISVVLLCAVILLLFRTIVQSEIFRFGGQNIDFDNFLLGLFNLVIGVEFTRMLCKHTPETVVEVMLFAIARQIIVSHPSIVENILGVIAIAALFAIRKFLLPSKAQVIDESKVVHMANEHGEKDNAA